MSKKALILFSSTFIMIEIVLYVLIFTISGRVNDWISFSAILMVFLFSLLFMFKNKYYIFTQIALFTTVMADLFLVVVEPRQQLVAMLFFSITQICYFLKLFFCSSSRIEKIIHLATRGALIVIVGIITIIILMDKIDTLSMVSVFYFTNLVLNVIFAFVQLKKSLFFAIGLFLFMICDIFIGLQCSIGIYINVTETNILYKIAFSPFNWAWLFYVPAQVLIVMSLLIDNRQYPNNK